MEQKATRSVTPPPPPRGSIRWRGIISGNPDEERGRLRPNVLLNADFTRPVNQRALDHYAALGNGYCIDAWRVGYCEMTLAGGAVESVTAASTNGECDMLSQLVEAPGAYAGKRMTLALEYTAYAGVPVYLSLHDGVTRHVQRLTAPAGVAVLTCEVSPAATQLMVSVWHGTDVGAASIRPVRVKLEVGDCFTGWIVPDPAVELVRCQRLGETLDGAILVEPIAINPSVGIVRNGSYKVRKRIVPWVTWSGNVYDRDGVNVIGTGTIRFSTRDALQTITYNFAAQVGDLYHIKGEEMFADAGL